MFPIDRLTSAVSASAGSFRPDRLRRLGNEFLWIVCGQTIAAAGTLVGIRVITGMLGASAYGELALSMTVAVLLQQVILTPLGWAFMRYFAAAQEGGFPRSFLKGASRLLFLASCIVLGIGLLAACVLLLAKQTQWLGLLAGMIFFSLFSGLGSAVDGLQNAARQRRIVAFHQGLLQWLRPFLAVVMMRLFTVNTAFTMAGFALSAAIVLTSQILMFARKFPHALPTGQEGPTGTGITTRQMLEFAWPVALWAPPAWIKNSSDRWSLRIFTDTRTVGLYSASYQIGYSPMTVASGALVALVGPVLFSSAGSGTDPARLKKVVDLNKLLVGVIIVATAAVALVSVFCHRQVYRLFLAKEFRPISMYLPLFVLAGGLLAAGEVISLGLETISTKRLIVPKLTTAALGALSNVAGAYFFGLPGVIFGLLSYSLIYCAWMSRLLFRLGAKLAAETACRPS